MATGLMAGKRGLIMGLANNRSIAWGVAKQLHAQGAEMAFSYQGEALKRRVEPLAAFPTRKSWKVAISKPAATTSR